MKTFAGIAEEFAEERSSKAVLIPVPYDGTSTWIKGADKGPEAMLRAAEHMELYDIETDSEPFRNGIFLHPPLKGYGTPEEMVKAVEDQCALYYGQKKLVSLIGGEHSISIGSMRSARDHYEDLSVLQIDAHADLRSKYDGSPYNHACAMHEISHRAPIVQVGIRSMDRSELPHMKRERVVFAHEMTPGNRWMDRILESLTRYVYITIDLDGLDPSIMPSTGTPEPGGLSWYTLQNVLNYVIERFRIVGFDLVELCPRSNQNAPDFLAAKLYYRILAEIFAKGD